MDRENSKTNRSLDMPDDFRRFISQVQGKLNRITLVSAAIRSAMFCAAVALLLCLWYTLRGYAVSREPIALVASIFFLAWAVVYLFTRFSFQRATVFADREFQLKDSLQSACEFSTSRDVCPFKRLDVANTSEMISSIDPKNFRRSFPARLMITVFLMIGSVCLLAALPEDPEITRKREELLRITQASTKAVEDIKKEFEEKEKGLDQEAKDALKKTKVPDKIQQLQASDNMKDSLRAFAKLEQELQSTRRQNDTAAENAFYKQLSKMLLQDKQTAQLGRELAKGNYKKAAQELKKFKIGEKSTKNKALSKANKLSKLSKAMQKAMSQSKTLSKNSAMAKDIDQLSKNISKMCTSNSKISDADCQKACRLTDKALKKMCRSMSTMRSRQKLATMINQMLCKSGSCQSMMRSSMNGGNCSNPSNQNSNGFGEGRAGNFNNKVISEKLDKTLALSSILTDGESTKTVSESATGSAQSNLSAQDRERKFRRTAENFVMREDVPEDYKRGVKRYFNSLNIDIDDKGAK